jgi:hypothetical protein
MSDTYETVDCCKLNSEKILNGEITCYGYSAIKDILQFEVDLCEKTDWRAKLLEAE